MKSWLDFSDLDSAFKVTAGFKLPNVSQKMLVRILSHEPLAGMLLNLHVCIIGAGSAIIGAGSEAD